MPRGGRRPGAGAPRGNYNAFKHGRHSRRLRELSKILALVPRTPRTVDGDPQEARLVSALLLFSFMDRLSLHSRTRTDPGFQRLHRIVKALQPPERQRPTKKAALAEFFARQSNITPGPAQQSNFSPRTTAENGSSI